MLSFFLSFIFSLFYSSWSGSVTFILFLSFLMLCFSHEFFYSKISFFIEYDYLSNSLVLLSLWVIFLCIISSQKTFNSGNSSNKFICLLLVLLLFLYFSFSFNSFLLFYLSFECSIIPVLFLIVGWGYQPERIQAGLYLLFYTMLASLPLLVLILLCFNDTGNYMHMFGFYSSSVSGVVNLFLVGAFLVKFPMYGFHLWLPKAHVEAPVAGSMILAGVLLKLGGYGMIRFLGLSLVFPDYLKSFLIIFSVWGGFLMSLVCLNQLDMKSLIACSSVVHMSTCIGSLFIYSDWGKQGAILMMLAHGLCSSGLFFLVGLIYNLTNSRSLLVNKGLIMLMPAVSLWWFLLLACNMACPPTINLLAEVKMISGLLNWSYILWIPLGLLVFFSCAYSIYLFSLSQHGKYFFIKQSFHSGYLLDYLVLALHWTPLNLFILFSGYLI